MLTLSSRVKRHADIQPQAPFCNFLSGGSARQISYAELYRNARAYAREFILRGYKSGDIVLISLEHSPHLFYSFVGASLAGVIPSFIPFPSPKQRPDVYWSDHEALFIRLRPRALVSYETNIAGARETLARFAIDAIVADDDLLDAGGDDLQIVYPGLSAALEDIACLQHSSGTTGLKKGVMLTHGAIGTHVAAYGTALNFSKADRIVSWLPLYHDMGFIACFMMSVFMGTELVALDPFEWSTRPHILFDAIAAYRPTLCWLPNFAFSHLVRTAKPDAAVDLTSIRAFVNCSEPCKPATLARFAERFAAAGVEHEKLAACYAMAENVFAVTQTPLGKAAAVFHSDADALARGVAQPARAGLPTQSLLSCGTVIDGVRIRVCANDGDECVSGTIGEIHVAGDSLFCGYYAEPERTRQRLRDGWYATGDMGFIHDGELFVTGRIDDMLIVNGRNFYAHEIEALVATLPGIAPGRVAAIGVDDDESDVTSIVVLAECADGITDPAAVAREIRVTVLERLGLAVARVVPLRTGSLIKTTSGKISRVKNKQLYVDDLLTQCMVTA